MSSSRSAVEVNGDLPSHVFDRLEAGTFCSNLTVGKCSLAQSWDQFPVISITPSLVLWPFTGHITAESALLKQHQDNGDISYASLFLSPCPFTISPLAPDPSLANYLPAFLLQRLQSSVTGFKCHSETVFPKIVLPGTPNLRGMLEE